MIRMGPVPGAASKARLRLWLRLLAVSRFGTHLEAGGLEQTLQVEADERLVLGDQHPHR